MLTVHWVSRSMNPPHDDIQDNTVLHDRTRVHCQTVPCPSIPNIQCGNTGLDQRPIDWPHHRLPRSSPHVYRLLSRDSPVHTIATSRLSEVDRARTILQTFLPVVGQLAVIHRIHVDSGHCEDPAMGQDTVPPPSWASNHVDTLMSVVHCNSMIDRYCPLSWVDRCCYPTLVGFED